MNSLYKQTLKAENIVCWLSLLGRMWFKCWTKLKSQLQTSREIEILIMVTSQREILLLLFQLYYVLEKKKKRIKKTILRNTAT